MKLSLLLLLLTSLNALAAPLSGDDRVKYRSHTLLISSDKVTFRRPYLMSLLAKENPSREELVEIGCYQDERIIAYCVRQIQRIEDRETQALIFRIYLQQSGFDEPPSDRETNYRHALLAHYNANKQIPLLTRWMKNYSEYRSANESLLFVASIQAVHDARYCPLLFAIYLDSTNNVERMMCKDMLLCWGGFEVKDGDEQRIKEALAMPHATDDAQVVKRYIAYLNKQIPNAGVSINESTSKSVAVYMLSSFQLSQPWLTPSTVNSEILFRLATR